MTIQILPHNFSLIAHKLTICICDMKIKVSVSFLQNIFVYIHFLKILSKIIVYIFSPLVNLIYQVQK